MGSEGAACAACDAHDDARPLLFSSCPGARAAFDLALCSISRSALSRALLSLAGARDGAPLPAKPFATGVALGGAGWLAYSYLTVRAGGLAYNYVPVPAFSFGGGASDFSLELAYLVDGQMGRSTS